MATVLVESGDVIELKPDGKPMNISVSVMLHDGKVFTVWGDGVWKVEENGKCIANGVPK
jgi:hypothetical protein